MRYFVSLDPTAAEPTPVDVNELPTGQLEVMLGGKPVDVDVVWVDGVASVRVQGHVIDLVTEGAGAELGVVVSGARTYARVESERDRASAAAKKSGGGAGEKVVKSPMPGRVVRMLVTAGADVEAGTTLCVIEAMKMENEVKAKAACRVLDVHVKEGATVEGGAKLFSLG